MTLWLREHRTIGAIVEMVVIVGGALLLSFLVKTFLAQPFFIPSDSMNDTLLTGDRVVVSKLSTSVSEVRKGDVIVFKDPDHWLPPATQSSEPTGVRGWVSDALTTVGVLPQNSDQHLIKRVIGTGGDHVVCCSEDGRIEVNDTPITEPYLRPGSIPSEMEFDVTVPAGHLWVMGDNRQNSEDSRYHQDDPGQGFVPVEDVTGTAFVKIWPASRWSWMTNPEDTFAHVPAP